MAYHKSRILQRLYDTVVDRKNHPVEGSYTNYLFEKGMDKILKKVGEESAEVIIAAKNRDEGELIYETADLIYHLIVALVEKGVALDQVYEELEKRHKPTSKLPVNRLLAKPLISIHSYPSRNASVMLIYKAGMSRRQNIKGTEILFPY